MIKKVVYATVIFFLLIGCSKKAEVPAGSSPQFSLKGIDNNQINLSDYKGRVVLIDFWATWCPPCRATIPVIERLYARYKDKGFVVLGLSVADSPDAVRSFRDANKMQYPIAMADDKTEKLYGVRGIPSMFLLDKDGRIVEHITGYDETLESFLDDKINSLLK